MKFYLILDKTFYKVIIKRTNFIIIKNYLKLKFLNNIKRCLKEKK
jgi:hypothetical protein